MRWDVFFVAAFSLFSSFLFTIYATTTLEIFQQTGYGATKLLHSKLHKARTKEVFKYFVLLVLFALFFEVIIYLNIVSHKLLLIPVYLSLCVVGVFTIVFKTEKSKKPLVYTPRVKRLLVTMFLVGFGICFAVFWSGFVYYVPGLALLNYLQIFAFIVIIVSNAINKLPESIVNNYYKRKAKAKLRKAKNLKVIAITGSYGKTTLKFILTHILKKEYFAVCTPNSFNTEMGIVKSILTDLKAHHEFFVVEMGADKLNDINKLCKIVKPDYAILTNIGVQHLKTFKTFENLVKTKKQIIDNLKDDGVAFFGVDSVPVRKIYLTTGAKKYSVGLHDKSAFCYTNKVSVTDSGSEFFAVCGGKRFKLKTTLLGEHNILNILLAVCVARSFGVSIQNIKSAVASIPPIKHRLQLVKLSNGGVLLDDSFNSNPIGSKNALKVLAQMPHKHKIVITPGMVELGKIQYIENFNFGKRMAEAATFVCVVNYENKEALMAGLRAGGLALESVKFFETFNEAFNFVKPNLNSESVVLIENDLPDNYI